MPDRLWPFAAQRPVTEVLEWSTDVLVTEAAEQRIALRTAPRSTLTFPHLIDATGLAEAAFRFLPTRAELDLAGFDDMDIFSH